MATEKRKLLWVDDEIDLLRPHILFLEGKGYSVTPVSNGEDAVSLVSQDKFDVILLDEMMPGLGGLEAVPLIQREAPRARILILTQYDYADYVRRFLRLGVAGYVLKKAAGAELISAIRAAHRGGLVLDPAIAREALKDAEAGSEPADDPYDSLTDRERQVLKLVAEGRSNKEISSLLDISIKTAMTHREHVMQKLNLHNRTDLTRFAIRRGIIQET